MVTVLCLFLLFRGSVPARQLMGASALVITFGYLMMITLNLLREPVALWTAFDLFGAFTAAVVTWACLFSRRVSAFLRYKEDFHS